MGMSSLMDGPADETNLTGVGEIRLIPAMQTKCLIPWLEVSLYSHPLSFYRGYMRLCVLKKIHLPLCVTVT